MRLIDLDKAVSICDEDNNTVIFANIGNAEVKAIPIEWIEHYVKNKFCLADWYGGFIGGINMMLDDWEKENQSLE